MFIIGKKAHNFLNYKFTKQKMKNTFSTWILICRYKFAAYILNIDEMAWSLSTSYDFNDESI